ARRSRATILAQTIDDLSTAEWQKASEVILEQAILHSADIEVKIELLGEAQQQEKGLLAKRSRNDLSPEPTEVDIDTPLAKKPATRTDKLLDRARLRADALENAGNFDAKLIRRWQCFDTQCYNHNGFCFIDFAGEHFDIDATQQSKWAKAISNGDPGISIERPPTKLYNFWVKTQGPVTQSSRRSIQWQERQEAQQERKDIQKERDEGKDFMTQMKEWNKSQMEMRMQEAMQDQMERNAARQEARDAREAAREASRASLPSMLPITAAPAASAAPTVHQPVPAMDPQWLQHMIASAVCQQRGQDGEKAGERALYQEPRRATWSPIGPPEEEENIIKRFFE
ncbi:MAG: hypothetical protein Q9179_007986, partial [Wetmoreana sp. 5 TL-2023]